MKKLSIIIVNYNSAEYLQKCLRSIFQEKSEFLKEVEIIVIDNASKERLPDFRSVFKEIIFIQNNKNLGFAKANNYGIKKSKGKYILLLNPDTLVSAKTLKHIVDFMDQNSEVGIATAKINLPNGNIDDASHRGFPTPWNAFCYFSGLAKIFPKSTFFNGYHLGYQNMNKVHEIDSCVGAFMIIRRKAGEEINWLDEDYFWYGEDLDFCYRIKQKNWKIMYIPQVSIIHFKGISSGIKKHSETLSKADEETKKRAQQARFEAMKIFYKKHYIKKYPSIVTSFILTGIKIKELITKI